MPLYLRRYRSPWTVELVQPSVDKLTATCTRYTLRCLYYKRLRSAICVTKSPHARCLVQRNGCELSLVQIIVKGFVDPALLDSISAALTHHSLPYMYPDRTGITQLLCVMS